MTGSTNREHFRTPLLHAPFHARIEALMEGEHWYDWAGYAAAMMIRDEELEYFAIRSQAALFDLTPMIKYRIEGPEAEAFLDRLTLRDVSKLKPGRVHYTAWCDDDGHVLDDGTLFRLAPDRFRLCCQERHLPWLADTALGFDVAIAEETDAVAGLALQGPTSASILLAAGFDIEPMKPFALAEFDHQGSRLLISRTGFTADLGYELFLDTAVAVSLWDRLWDAGQVHGISAIGYDALNRARIEAGFIVANADFVTSETALRADRARQPDEIGLGWMVDMAKPHFNGRRAIASARAAGTLRHVLVGLEIEGNEPATGSIVYHGAKTEAGVVTAAIWSPTAKRNIALASLERPFGEKTNDGLWVEIYAPRELRYHKLKKKARVVERPFVRLPRRTQTPPVKF
ncbi:MAG: aminomethyltransferase family protein [Nitratireductor sp.]|nr:aminomethyltransferase family protein [Nitratireductor sp.]